MVDYIIIGIIVLLVLVVLFFTIRKRKLRKKINAQGCGSGCAGCNGGCH